MLDKAIDIWVALYGERETVERVNSRVYSSERNRGFTLLGVLSCNWAYTRPLEVLEHLIYDFYDPENRLTEQELFDRFKQELRECELVRIDRILNS